MAGIYPLSDVHTDQPTYLRIYYFIYIYLGLRGTKYYPCPTHHHTIHSAQKYFHAHCYVAPYPRTYGLFILFAIYLYICYISIYLIYEPFYVQIICPVHRYYTVYRRISIMTWMITDPKLLA